MIKMAAAAAADVGSDGDVDERVHRAAKEGLAITLYALLSASAPDDQKRALAKVTSDESGQATTPLIVAARNGHDKAVQIILQFSPDLSQTGTVKFGSYVIEGASALWAASGAGHLSTIRLLVARGADVNQTTAIRSTPLRAACFEGRLDIVQFLCESGADIEIANKYNNSCLMIAAYKGHTDVVAYLLQKGANPSVSAKCGATALHFAAEAGHVGIVAELLRRGGDPGAKNDSGMTPLSAAAERCQAGVVDFILREVDHISRKDRVDALELLGASFANDKENYSLEKAHRYLSDAMAERWRAGAEPMPKPESPSPPAAYGSRLESRTMDDLLAIRDDADSIQMEGLIIRERVLGPDNPEVTHPVIYRGAVFADSARFDRCLQLWLHCLRIKQRAAAAAAGPGASLSKDLLRFAQVFSQIIHLSLAVSVADLTEVLSAVHQEIKACMKRRAEGDGAEDDPDALEDEEGLLNTFLYLVVILTKMPESEEECFPAMQIVYQVVKMDPRRRSDNASLLHLAVSAETPVDDFHTCDVVRFPSTAATQLLLKAGADVEAMDRGRNTPLHCIVTYQRYVNDFVTLHGIITTLVEAGAHCDAVNSSGQTPCEKAASGVAEIILKSTQQSVARLKCLAAQSVKSNDLNYEGQVPASLVRFINLHGP